MDQTPVCRLLTLQGLPSGLAPGGLRRRFEQRPKRRRGFGHGLCLLPFCPQKLHLRGGQERRCRLRPDQPARETRCAFVFGAGMLISASSPLARPSSTGCGRTWERRERRKAAPKEIAAHARWCWRGSGAAGSTYEPFNACILLLGQLDGAELITIEDLASRRRTASVAAGDGRRSRLAMRLLHARDRDEPVRRLPFRRAA